MTPLSNLSPKYLTEWREKRGWQISYVAKRVGRSYGWMWGLENADGNVPLYAALLFVYLDRDLEPFI